MAAMAAVGALAAGAVVPGAALDALAAALAVQGDAGAAALQPAAPPAAPPAMETARASAIGQPRRLFPAEQILEKMKGMDCYERNHFG